MPLLLDKKSLELRGNLVVQAQSKLWMDMDHSKPVFTLVVEYGLILSLIVIPDDVQ